MSTLTRLKLSLALGGLILFGTGIRFQQNALRWTGLACVAAAWIMRFRKPPAEPR